MQDLDTGSQFSDWTLHDRRIKILLSYLSDIRKTDLIDYRREKNSVKKPKL